MATNGADLQGWIRERLFDAVPIAVAIIDAQLNVVQANEAFERMFGPWRSRRCHAVYKDRETPCEQCAAFATFEDGATRVTEETGIDRTGRRTQYIKHTFPIRSADGTIPYLVEMSTDVSEFERMRREHNILFERVPCDIVLIDRSLRIVRANGKVRETFGDVVGRSCFEVFKGTQVKCPECPAQETFRDMRIHVGRSVAQTRW